MIAEKFKTYEPGTVDKIKLVVILKSQKPEPKFKIRPSGIVFAYNQNINVANLIKRLVILNEIS